MTTVFSAADLADSLTTRTTWDGRPDRRFAVVGCYGQALHLDVDWPPSEQGGTATLYVEAANLGADVPDKRFRVTVEQLPDGPQPEPLDMNSPLVRLIDDALQTLAPEANIRHEE